GLFAAGAGVLAKRDAAALAVAPADAGDVAVAAPAATAEPAGVVVELLLIVPTIAVAVVVEDLQRRAQDLGVVVDVAARRRVRGDDRNRRRHRVGRPGVAAALGDVVLLVHVVVL